MMAPMDTDIFIFLGAITLLGLLRARLPNKNTFGILKIMFVSERIQVMNKKNTTKNHKEK